MVISDVRNILHQKSVSSHPGLSCTNQSHIRLYSCITHKYFIYLKLIQEYALQTLFTVNVLQYFVMFFSYKKMDVYMKGHLFQASFISYNSCIISGHYHSVMVLIIFTLRIGLGNKRPVPYGWDRLRNDVLLRIDSRTIPDSYCGYD